MALCCGFALSPLPCVSPADSGARSPVASRPRPQSSATQSGPGAVTPAVSLWPRDVLSVGAASAWACGPVHVLTALTAPPHGEGRRIGTWAPGTASPRLSSLHRCLLAVGRVWTLPAGVGVGTEVSDRPLVSAQPGPAGEGRLPLSRRKVPSQRLVHRIPLRSERGRDSAPPRDSVCAGSNPLT